MFFQSSGVAAIYIKELFIQCGLMLGVPSSRNSAQVLFLKWLFIKD